MNIIIRINAMESKIWKGSIAFRSTRPHQI